MKNIRMRIRKKDTEEIDDELMEELEDDEVEMSPSSDYF